MAEGEPRDLSGLRSYLFAPGSNARILGKVLHTGADAAILDLEDAVAAADKVPARKAVAALVAAQAAAAACAVFVRVNQRDGRFDAEDVAAVCAPGLDGLVLPKAEHPQAVAAVDDLLTRLEPTAGLRAGSVRLLPAIESAAGVLNALPLAQASPRVVRLSFGATDFLADIDGRGQPDGPATVHARGHLVLACRAAGVGAPTDSVHTAVHDLEGLESAARRARDLGFCGKTIIHPSHVEPVHRVFTPTAQEVAAARRILDGFTAAEQQGSAAYLVEGQFVDPAVVARARRVLAVAEHAGGAVGSEHG